MTRKFWPVAGLAVLLMTGSASSTPTWDRAAAAKYLDARMDLWWEKAKKLKTGDGEARCLSCHTALPYLLARPALRKAEGVATPTANEQRIFDTVLARVAYRADDQPFYEQTSAKKLESRGVEAVLNAVVLTQRDAGAKTASPETARAMAHMWDAQREDGAWDWLDFGNEPAESADSVFQGAAFAALAAGHSADKNGAGRKKLRTYLAANLAGQNLYNRTWALLATAGTTDFLNKATQERVAHDLEAAQRSDGGWSLAQLGPWRWSATTGPFKPPGVTDAALLEPSDGFATGFIVYALRTAGHKGAAIERGQRWLIAHQTPQNDDPAWAPWRTHSLNQDREHGGTRGEIWRRLFMSDMATAFGVLALQ